MSAFGCGAFRNPVKKVAAAYHAIIKEYAKQFDVIAFGIVNAAYGPDNFTPFVKAFENWSDDE